MNTKYIANGIAMGDEFERFLSGVRFGRRPTLSGKLDASMKKLEQQLIVDIAACKSMIKDPIGKRSEMNRASFSENGRGGYYIELKHGKRTIRIDRYMTPDQMGLEADSLDEVVQITQNLLAATQQRHPIMVQAVKNAITNKPASGPRASSEKSSKAAA